MTTRRATTRREKPRMYGVPIGKRRVRAGAISLLVVGLALMAPPASAQTLQDIGRALDALAGPQQRPAAPRAQAQGQGGDRCNNYANQMISFDQRARQMRCSGWTSHSNYQNHYNWCQARPAGAAQGALNDWGSRFQRCQFQASGSPAAQPPRAAANQRPGAGDQSRRPVCSSFGRAAANWERRAMSQGCNIRGANHTLFNGNQASATNWCMGTSDESFRGRSPQALGHKGALERHCSVQLRRPVRL